MKRLLLSLLILAIAAQTALTTTTARAQALVDDMKFVTDVTIPDGTYMTPGQSFTKTWRIKNTGTSTWSTSYTFGYDSGEYMSGNPSSQAMISNVGIDNTVDLSVTMTAPSAPGDYTGFWQMKNASGNAFGKKIWVNIKVARSASDASGTVSTIVVDSASTPQPKNFDFREISGNTVEIYFNSSWIRATKSPEGKYTIYDGVGAYTLVYFNDCTTDFSHVVYWTGIIPHFGQKCEQKSRQISDSGLLPSTTLSQEGAVAFYSYMNGLTFGAVGALSGDIIVGTNGYTIYELGKTATAKLSTLNSVLSKAGPLVMVVSYITYAERLFVVTYPIQPIPVATPGTKFDIASYTAIAGLYNAVLGHSKGDFKGSNWWVSWQIISLNGVCSMMMYLRLPKSGGEGFQLDNFSQKFDQECDPGKIIAFMFEIVKQAMKAGVSVDTCLWFLREFLPKIANDFKIDPALIDAILKLLASL